MDVFCTIWNLRFAGQLGEIFAQIRGERAATVVHPG
jgi:hypothetical protein